MWLTIDRAGQTLYDNVPYISACGEHSCDPGGGLYRDSVRVRDLDGDGEPEVLVDLWSGGAHCCSFARVYEFDGRRYRSFAHGFADAGYRLGDIDGDGAAEFVSSDARFAYYADTSFASSRFPVQIWRYGGYGTGLIDVTTDYPGRIRADARRLWRDYLRVRHLPRQEPRGAIAAWAADRYQLGKRRSALRTLRSLARRRELPEYGGVPSVADQLRFVSRLDRDLLRVGYG